MLHKYIDTAFSFDELLNASILMLTRITPKKDADINVLVDKEILNLIYTIVKEVYKNYSINIDFSKFMTPFSLHLKNLMIRIKNGIHVNNIQFKQIKLEYTFIYSISVFISQIIENYIHIALSEDEISFIALHIGTIIEEQQILNNKVRCLIFASDYYSFWDRLAQQLSHSLHDILYIGDVVTSLDDCVQWEDFDLLITISSINQVLPIPYFQIKPFLTHDDIHKCYEYVENIKQQKQIILKKLDYFFHENCFLY